LCAISMVEDASTCYAGSWGIHRLSRSRSFTVPFALSTRKMCCKGSLTLLSVISSPAARSLRRARTVFPTVSVPPFERSQEDIHAISGFRSQENCGNCGSKNVPRRQTGTFEQHASVSNRHLKKTRLWDPDWMPSPGSVL
jgi:hypothetical protein